MSVYSRSFIILCCNKILICLAIYLLKDQTTLLFIFFILAGVSNELVIQSAYSLTYSSVNPLSRNSCEKTVTLPLSNCRMSGCQRINTMYTIAQLQETSLQWHFLSAVPKMEQTQGTLYKVGKACAQ